MRTKMFFVKKYRFEDVESIVTKLDIAKIYMELHQTDVEPSYFCIKAGERDKRHLRRVREVLERFDVPEELLANKNIALTCRAISKCHLLIQLGMEIA